MGRSSPGAFGNILLWAKVAHPSDREITVQQSRSPIRGTTRLYGVCADPIAHAQVPAVFNALLDQRGVDAVFVPLHVTTAHFATAVAGLRALRNCAGFYG